MGGWWRTSKVGRPYFALHYWNGEGLITHFDTVEEHEVLARFSPKRQGLIRMLNKERAAGEGPLPANAFPTVIASIAKQSNAAPEGGWIASSLCSSQ